MCTTGPSIQVPTFGISLRLLCERSGVEVPVILGDILRWLAAHALAQPDVFAQHPKSAATSQLKSAIDSGIPLVELVQGTHPAVVGSLLKRWLEELPDPLLNWDQQVELLSACKDEGCIEARIASLNDAVALVDPISLGTLKPLLLFLQQYCFRQRRFDQQLLQVAVAFAPLLFPAALAAGPAELRLAEETVATLVSNALHVFNPTLAANVPVVTPQALCEAAAEVTAMESSQRSQPQEPQPQPIETTSSNNHQQSSLLQQQQVSSFPESGDATKACAALRRRSSGGGAAEQQQHHSKQRPCEHVDDVALLSIDQHLSQHRPLQQPHESPAEKQQLQRPRQLEADTCPADADANNQDVPPYEPYLADATFLASFHSLVDSCVASALFTSWDCSSGGGCVAHEGDCALPGQADVDLREPHCSSFTFSCTSAHLQSSGGGSNCTSRTGSCNSTPHAASDVRPSFHSHEHELLVHRKQQHPQTGLRQKGSAASDDPDTPYSPRAVLVTAATQVLEGSHVAPVDPRGKALASQPVIVVDSSGGGGSKTAPTATTAAALAELARREVSEGSVFCIISAQPGGAAAVVPAGTAGNGPRLQIDQQKVTSGNAAAAAANPVPQRTSPPSQQQTLVVGAVNTAEPTQASGVRAASTKRPTEGGATSARGASVPEHAAQQEPTKHQEHPHGQQLASTTTVGRHPISAGCNKLGEQLPRRMTMGGGDGSSGGDSVDAATIATQSQRQVAMPACGRTVRSSPREQPSAPAQQPGGGGATVAAPLGGGSTSRSVGSGARDSQGHRHHAQAHTLPPAATSSVSAALHGAGNGGSPHVAELGVAGHLRVCLTSAYTLVVRELSTPEAQVHRVPIRSMSVSALQSEKERLKRQLKDIAAAYETLAGRSLVPALKEPLRPVYVRYHKIKALLNSGRAGLVSQARDGQQQLQGTAGNGSGRGGNGARQVSASSSSRYVAVA